MSMEVELFKAAVRLSRQRWKGLQPKSPIKVFAASKYSEGHTEGRFLYTPEEYKEYTKKFTKEERKKLKNTSLNSD